MGGGGESPVFINGAKENLNPCNNTASITQMYS